MGRYPVPLDYTWDMRITSFDVGQDRKLKLSSQLKLQQEVGERQFEQGGWALRSWSATGWHLS